MAEACQCLEYRQENPGKSFDVERAYCTAAEQFVQEMTTTNLFHGGHVRVGLEDNASYRRGEPAENNAQLVEHAVPIAGEFSRSVATPDEARDILGLEST